MMGAFVVRRPLLSLLLLTCLSASSAHAFGKYLQTSLHGRGKAADNGSRDGDGDGDGDGDDTRAGASDGGDRASSSSSSSSDASSIEVVAAMLLASLFAVFIAIYICFLQCWWRFADRWRRKEVKLCSRRRCGGKCNADDLDHSTYTT